MMNWQELSQMLQEPITQITVLGVTLLYYCVCYSAKVAGGKRRTRKQGIKWSWERFWSDIVDRLQAIYLLVAIIIGADMTQWLAPLIGIRLDETVTTVVNAGLIVAIPFVAGLAELLTATKNAFKLWGWSKNIKALNLTDEDIANITDENFGQIANDVYTFVDTFTKKSVREQLIEDGVDVESFEGEVVGKGSGNTYPEPYRGAKKDSLVDPSTCYNRECVSYTAWKICELTGAWPKRTGGMNAKQWVDRLPSWGYKLVSAPKNGGKYIGVLTSGTYGHVVWFEGFINNSTVQISEYNYADAGNYNLRNIPILSYIWFEIQAPNGTQPTEPSEPEETADSNGFAIGDKVLPVKYVDYTGTRIYKTKQYYTITGLEGDRAVLSWGGKTYAAVNTNNLKHVDADSVQPTEPTNEQIEKGDTVVPTRLVDYVGTPLYSYDPNYKVIDLNGDRAVLEARGQIWAAMNVKDLKKV